METISIRAPKFPQPPSIEPVQPCRKRGDSTDFQGMAMPLNRPFEDNTGSRAAALYFIIIFIVLILGASNCPADNPPESPSVDTLQAGTRVDYPPFAFINEFGRADGFSVELLREISVLMGLTVNLRMGPIDKLRESLDNGEIDILIGAEYNDGSKRDYIFGQPHTVLYDAIFYGSSGPDFEQIEDLKRHHVVTLKNDIASNYLISNEITENIKTAETVAEALKMVSGGRVEAALLPMESGDIIIDSYNLRGVKRSRQPVTRYYRSIAFAAERKNAELLGIVEQGLSLMRSNGAYDRLYNRWFGVQSPGPSYSSGLIRTVMIAGIILVAVLSGLTTYTMSLRRRIVGRNRSLARAINKIEKNEEELNLYRNQMEDLVADRTEVLKEKMTRLERDCENTRVAGEDIKFKYEQLQKAFDGDESGRWEYSLDRGTLFWDRRTFRHFGVEEREGIPSLNKFLDMFEGDSRRRLRQAIDTAVSQGDRFSIDLSLDRSKTGSAYLRLSGNAIRDGVGRVSRIVGLVRDDSEYYETAEELRRQYTGIAGMIENDGGGFMILSENLTVQFCNRAALEILGVEPNETFGRALFTEIRPDLADSELQRMLAKDPAGERRDNKQIWIKRRDRQDCYEIRIIKSNENTAVLFTIVTDRVEEDRRLRESLKQNENKLRETDENLRRSETELQNIGGELHRTKNELDETAGKLHDTEEKLDESESARNRLENELKNTQERLGQIGAEREQALSEIEWMTGELDRAGADLERIKEELNHKSDALEMAENRLRESEGNIDKLENELRNAESIMQTANETLRQSDEEKKNLENNFQDYRKDTEQRLQEITQRLDDAGRVTESYNDDLKKFMAELSAKLNSPIRSVHRLIDLLDNTENRSNALTEVRSDCMKLEILSSDLEQWFGFNGAENSEEPIDTNSMIDEIIRAVNRENQEQDRPVRRNAMLPVITGHRNSLCSMISKLIRYVLTAQSGENSTIEIGFGRFLNTPAGSRGAFYIAIEGNYFDEEQRRDFENKVSNPNEDNELFSGPQSDLCIAGKIAQLHHGVIWLDHDSTGRTLFCFYLPGVQYRELVPDYDRHPVIV